MLSRVPYRLLILLAAVVAGVGGFLPALPVRAHGTAPPFEVTFPQEAPVTDFSSTFGAPRSGGRRHHGTDLMAPRLTAVYAVADGEVIHVGDNRLSGRNVVIQHVDDWTSHYVHLNNDNIDTDDGDAPWTLTVAPGIEEGARVEAGQLIAWVGDSGNAEGTSPHTHFELQTHGRAIDPYPVLVKAFRRALQTAESEHQAWLESVLAAEPGGLPMD